MATFSITCPNITDEEDKREKESLTREEREAIENDILGKLAPSYTETPAMKRNAVMELKSAVELIEEGEKEAYLRALEVCPTLLQTETDPIHFLRAENYDAWKAARRLVTYWSARAEIFGAEKAFVPLDSTEEGPLCSDARRLLGRAIWVPNPSATDPEKRGVVYFDRSKIENGKSFRVSSVRG